MPNSTIVAMAKLFMALSDQTRLRLLSLMIGDEVSVGYLAEALGESQPKISRHLAYLRTAGLVSTRRYGKWIYYGIAEQEDAAVERALQTTLDGIARRGITRLASSPVVSTAVEEDDRVANIYAGPEMSDWRPAEMDVFLL